MKNKKLIGFIVAASLVAGTTATFAQDNQPAGPSSPPAQEPPSQSEPDTSAQPASPEINEPAGAEKGTFDKETFIKETAQSGVAEVNMAQVGTQKAQDPALKEAAQQLVTDHSKLNDQLKELAQKKGITLSTEVDSKHQRMIDHLSGLSGAEFDKAFAQHMAQGHKKSIAKFKKAAANTEDTEISQFAKGALPTLEGHLTLIQKWAPDATAGTAIEEPAGAEKKSDDTLKQDQPYQSPQKDESDKEQNQIQSPDDAGQSAPE